MFKYTIKPNIESVNFNLNKKYFGEFIFKKYKFIKHSYCFRVMFFTFFVLSIYSILLFMFFVSLTYFCKHESYPRFLCTTKLVLEGLKHWYEIHFTNLSFEFDPCFHFDSWSPQFTLFSPIIYSLVGFFFSLIKFCVVVCCFQNRFETYF